MNVDQQWWEEGQILLSILAHRCHKNSGFCFRSTACRPSWPFFIHTPGFHQLLGALVPLLSIVSSNADHFAIRSSCQSPWTPLMRLRPPSPRWRLWHSEPALLGWRLTKKDSFQFVGNPRHWGCRIIAIIPPADLHTVFTRWQIPNVAGVATAPTVAQLGLVYGQGHADSCAEWRPGQRHHQSRLSHRPPQRMRERSNYPKWSTKLTKTKWIYLTRLLSQPPALPIATRLVVSRRTPYTDMAVWGPFQHRLQKKIRSEVQLRRRVLIELYGPSEFESWRECYIVFRTGAIMFRAGPLWEDDQTLQWEMESLAGPSSTRQIYEPVSNMLQDFEGWVKKRMTEHSKRDSITISILPSPGSGFGGELCMEALGFWHREVTALHALPGQDDQPECPGWGWCPNQAQRNRHYVHKIDACTDPATITTFETHQASQRPRHRGASCWRRWELHPHPARHWALLPIPDRRVHWERQQRQLRQKQQSPTSVLKVPGRNIRCQQMLIRWTKAASSKQRSQGPR